MAAGSPVKCDLSAEALQAIDQWTSGTLRSVVLKCVTAKQVIHVEATNSEDVPIDELGESLPDTSPRFVLVHFRTKDDAVHTSEYSVLIHFNPMDTQPSIKRSYELSKENLERALVRAPNFKNVQLNDSRDFTDVNLVCAIQGLKGTATERLAPMFETYGRQAVSGRG